MDKDENYPHKIYWREILGISPTQYKSYADLKRKAFIQALNEINLKTSYKLIMTEEKEGRKVIRVRFDFIPDKVCKVVDKDGKYKTRHIKPLKQ